MAKLSVRTMAAALGVSKSQVQRSAEAGMPMDDVEQARIWRLNSLDMSRTASGRIDRMVDAAPAPAAPSPPPPDGDPPLPDVEPASTDEHSSAYRSDRARNERIKADRAEIELQQLRGELVSVRDVEQLEFTAARLVRDRLEMLAPSASADLRALVLSLVPEQHREALATALELHVFERRLADLVRQALSDASKAIEEARRDDDDDPD